MNKDKQLKFKEFSTDWASHVRELIENQQTVKPNLKNLVPARDINEVYNTIKTRKR